MAHDIKTHPKVRVIEHQARDWLDDDTCVTWCGLQLLYGSDDQRRCLKYTQTEPCPLCAAAEIVDNLTAEDLFGL